MIVLDTTVVIDYLKGEDVVVRTVSEHITNGEAAITTVTEYELFKTEDKYITKELLDFVSSVDIYDFDRKAAKEASSIFKKLKKKGKITNENDIMIAGIALSNNDTLITEDEGFKHMDSRNIIVI